MLFVLNATERKHLILNPSNTSEIIQRNLLVYVDNVLTSVGTIAINFFTYSINLLKSDGFNYRTRKSNNEKIMDKASRENVIDTYTDANILGMR